MRKERTQSGKSLHGQIDMASGELLAFTMRGTLIIGPTGASNLHAKSKPVAAVPADKTEAKRSELPGPRLAYSISELTKILPIGRSTIYAEMKSGSLVARKLGGRRTVVLKADLENWLNAQPRVASN